MIVEMKKVSLLVLASEKHAALKKLRKLGLVHISEIRGNSEKLTQLNEQKNLLVNAAAVLSETIDKKAKPEDISCDEAEALETAAEIIRLTEEKKENAGRINSNLTEIDRVEKWGDFDPAGFADLAAEGIYLTPYEMPLEGYKALGEDFKTITLGTDKYSARVLLVTEEPLTERPEGLPNGSVKFDLPVKSITEIKAENEAIQAASNQIDEKIRSMQGYLAGLEEAQVSVDKKIEFENYESGMEAEALSDDPNSDLKVSFLVGFIPTEDLEKLTAAAAENKWGIAVEDPTEEDNVPTKLRNNKFVSLVYPLTDFLGTVPGYFEYDISGWFLGFILIFFGIIFGDGGYGLLITGVAAALIIKAKMDKKEVEPLFLLVGLFGIATIIWGLVTCTWFGIEASSLPTWLQNLSVPVLSNVNEDRIWYPFWTNGEAGLTTAQNLQIFCFALAVVQLSVAHVKAIIRYRKSPKFLGDLGSMLMLWGMFYIVLTLVVNGEVFGLSRVIAGIPVGTVSIALIAVGFVLNFIFGSYEGSIKDSVLDSLQNIISILLGVVNIFSDIVSYIRLWAVGLAGAAIASTVNEMAGPLFGNLIFIVLAVILLVFGHGLNMILNVLSLIVHGVRLNTLEFSSHLGMSWSGHKYEPFKE